MRARVGDWKLVRKGGQRPGKIDNWELYNLEQDRSELNNLAAEQSELVKQLSEQWEAFALHAHAKPWPNARKKISRRNPRNRDQVTWTYSLNGLTELREERI